MKTNEQRIAVLHQRPKTLRRRQEKAALSSLASLCLLLSVILIRLAAVSAGDHGRMIDEDTFTAASLLDESIGGYVLAAVLAFMAGVCITVAVIRWRNRSGGGSVTEDSTEKTEKKQ